MKKIIKKNEREIQKKKNNLKKNIQWNFSKDMCILDLNGH